VEVRHGESVASQPEASLAWTVATSPIKRRQQVLKPRSSPDIHSRWSLRCLTGGGSTDGTVSGEGPSVRPWSWTGAKAQDGLPGNLRAPTHVHTMREPGKKDHRLNNDPGPLALAL
jgi:hypothetical protein